MIMRYLSFHDYFINKYGGKLLKIPIYSGLSCPHLANGGCVFCGEEKGAFFKSVGTISEQKKLGLKHLGDKWKNVVKTYAFFQSYTNTYGDIDYLDRIYHETYKNFDGMIISTRPDSISDQVLDLLEYYNKKMDLWVEIGLESASDRILQEMNRQHNFSSVLDADNRLRAKNIDVCYHVIFGWRYETDEEFLKTMDFLYDRRVFGVKFHSLFIEKNTKLFDIYRDEDFPLFTKDDYTDRVCDAISLLHKDTVVHRLTGDPNRNLLFEPKWTLDKLKVIGEINKKLKERDIYQSCRR